MTTIALLGAGGKMGTRLASNLSESDYTVLHTEVSEAGRARLKEATGLECVSQDEALAKADVVVMAVPDKLIGTILAGFVEQLRPGTAVIMLDAAAPHAGRLPKRDDVTYFIAHPCHPPIFNDETEPAAQQDHFGGIAAKQHIVCALMQGPDAHYALCEGVARAFYRPVMRAHRVTVEQMAILEPGLSETVGATLVLAMREAVDKVASLGVPYEAAEDFLLGHLSVELAIAFEKLPGARFSDGALLAIDKAKTELFKEGWLDRVFTPEAIRRSVEAICDE